MITDQRQQGYNSASVITPVDNAEVNHQFNKAIWCEGADTTVSLLLWNGQTVSFKPTANTVLMVHFKAVNSTGTAATRVIGLGWA